MNRNAASALQHARVVKHYSDELLQSVAADLSARRWRDEWSENRLTAVRAEIARRKAQEVKP